MERMRGMEWSKGTYDYSIKKVKPSQTKGLSCKQGYKSIKIIGAYGMEYG